VQLFCSALSVAKTDKDDRESHRVLWTICVTSDLIFRQFLIVRCAPVICSSLLLASTVLAQQQERSLIDRLLRPDMELQNNAQSKKFSAKPANIENRGTVGTFFLQPTRPEKQAADSPSFVPKKYNSRSFENGLGGSSSIQNRQAKLPEQLPTSAARNIHETHDSHLEVADRNFAGEREFRDQGKSQKSLDRQNPPLTIDQVRELLNKNK
jgi:hypothetical protein